MFVYSNSHITFHRCGVNNTYNAACVIEMQKARSFKLFLPQTDGSPPPHNQNVKIGVQTINLINWAQGAAETGIERRMKSDAGQ
jgi:hypothetical protein